MKNQRLGVETLVHSSKTTVCALLGLVQGAEAIGANVQFLFSTPINDRALVDVRHKTPIGRIVRVAHAVTVLRTFAANSASLCHVQKLPSIISANDNGQDNTTID
jgi:hypothetical protein